MPTLETPAGKPVDVTPVDPAGIDAAFHQAMNDDGPDEQAPPKRQRRAPAADDGQEAKPRRARATKADKPRTAARAAVTLDDGARREGVKGITQIGAGVALMLGRATGKVAYAADAVILSQSAEQIADACVLTAAADPRFAAALDRVCAAGPYAALIGVGVSVGMQIARNHRPAVELPGTVHPDELLATA